MTHQTHRPCPNCGTMNFRIAAVCKRCRFALSLDNNFGDGPPRSSMQGMTPPPSHSAMTVLIVLAIGFGSVIMVGILAAIALPNFIGAQAKAKTASVKCNMRTTQLAVESYATDHHGKYPKTVDNALKSYFPGGGNDGKTPATVGFANPFTGKSEWPTLGDTDETLDEMRENYEAELQPGEVEYTPLKNGDSYGIRGGSETGVVILGRDPNSALVLSNE